MTDSKKYKLSEWSTWTSSSQGTTKTKVAECVAVVPSGVWVRRIIERMFDPKEWSFSAIMGARFSASRDHESYIFAEPPSPRGKKRKLYWPKVAGLKKIEDPYYVDFEKDPK